MEVDIREFVLRGSGEERTEVFQNSMKIATKTLDDWRAIRKIVLLMVFIQLVDGRFL